MNDLFVILKLFLNTVNEQKTYNVPRTQNNKQNTSKTNLYIYAPLRRRNALSAFIHRQNTDWPESFQLAAPPVIHVTEDEDASVAIRVSVCL